MDDEYCELTFRIWKRRLPGGFIRAIMRIPSSWAWPARWTTACRMRNRVTRQDRRDRKNVTRDARPRCSAYSPNVIARIGAPRMISVGQISAQWHRATSAMARAATARNRRKTDVQSPHVCHRERDDRPVSRSSAVAGDERRVGGF